MPETTPTADELLAHADWLHGLASALVGGATADDVVQDTFEIALTKPPKHAGPIRPWLGGVARNLARMTTRGRVRREQREQAVPATAEVPTPEQLVERAQLQQQVARIVLELPEPQRATLLLRFFEGMTAAEIARVQGVPAATVRGRIKDALDRVRATLDVQHGQRKRWVALLAPIVPARFAAIATKGLLVKITIKLVIAIAIVLLVVLGVRWTGVWGPSHNEAVATTPSGNAPSKPAGAPTGGDKPRPTPAMIETVHDDDPRGPLRLEGQVIDEHDAPVGGARVAIDAHPPIVVETEADGGFVFEGLIPRDYQLEASAGDGYAGPAHVRVTAHAEPVTLRMRRGGSLEVVVTAAATGKPVASADVELRSTLTWHGKSDGNGVVRLRGIGAVWAPLAVRANGFAPAATMVWASGDPAAPARVAVALVAGAALAGRAVDETGKPVAGARIIATSASEPFPVVDSWRDGVIAGADGAFTIPAVAAGTWRLTATHGDLAPAVSAPLVVDGARPRSGVELVLARGGMVRGTVRGKDGQPVAGADVLVVVRGYREWRARRQAVTSADGTFVVAGLPQRAMDVVATHETGSSAVVAVDLAARREQSVALTLDITATIEGIVVDKNGTPLGDAPVIAEPEQGSQPGTSASVRGAARTTTDQGGHFTFAGLPDGGYHVGAARPGSSDAMLFLSPTTLVRPGAPALRVVVASAARIVGKVAFADGQPPVAFSIIVGDQTIPFASQDGKFAVNVPAGTHALGVSGPGFIEKWLRDVAVPDDKDADVGTIMVAAGRSVSGRVLDESGAPVANAQVVAGTGLTGGGNELYIPEESPGAKTTQSGDDGRFTLDGFEPGALAVVAGKTGVGRSASVRVPPGPDSVRLDLVLAATTSLEGTIRRDGKPAGEIVVLAYPIGALASTFFTVAGSDGTFAHDALAPGPYVVAAMFGGGGPRPKDMYLRRVELVPGQRGHVDIDATTGPLSLTIDVKNGPAAVFAIQAAVDATSFDDLRDGSRLPIGDQIVPLYIRNTLAGPVEITGMHPGLHTACAQAMGGDDKLACMQVKLDAGQAKRRIELVLPK